ncbi:winged helix-turn-helix domain-containing protein [Variovorax boronicumulans]|uniref:winged helix-turn-helix domain-containing protein n=1 Tax=Variovorax boronicumulans TaxID=436515 RepID=UPI0012FD65C1|nr:winged helix-turn-helix domain-containing protein [Variovorax boronicumulans]
MQDASERIPSDDGTLASLPMVAIDSAGAKWPALREGMDQLGIASMAFKSLSDLTFALDAGRNFGLLMLRLPADADASWLLAVRKLTDAAILFVVDVDSAKSILRIGVEYLGQNNCDFLHAPFGLDEIKTRAQLLLNRSVSVAQVKADDQTLIFQDYFFRHGDRKVFYRQQEIRLQAREYDIAVGFFKNINRVLAREEILSILRLDKIEARSRVLDVHVSKIRNKLKLIPENGLILVAVYGRGYELRAVNSAKLIAA